MGLGSSSGEGRRVIVQPKPFRIVGGTDIPEPTFTASAVEKLAIKRFLDFAGLDIKYQFQQLQKALPFDRAAIEDHQAMAVALSNYLVGLKTGLDAMIKIETNETDGAA